MTDTLVAFLRRMLDEDEAVAIATVDATHRGDPPRWVYADDRSIRDTSRDAILRVTHTWNQEAAHIVRHDPARVLREIAAKRAIIGAHARGHECLELSGSGDHSVVDGKPWEYWEAEHTLNTGRPCFVLRTLAAVYADRDGYEADWAPA